MALSSGQAAGGAAETTNNNNDGKAVHSPLIAQSDSEHWFLFDALGTTLGLTSDVGALTDAFLYEAKRAGKNRVVTSETITDGVSN